jgi:hypothetical protein
VLARIAHPASVRGVSSDRTSRASRTDARLIDGPEGAFSSRRALGGDDVPK